MDAPAEPEEARDEHELQLADDRPFEPHEQVVEPSVLEVILDPGAADPADATVDDDDLAVVDVPEGAEVPPGGAARAERAVRGARLRRPDDADLGAGGGEPLVERMRGALGVGALPVDHDPDWDTGARLVDQRRPEGVADDARAGSRTG